MDRNPRVRSRRETFLSALLVLLAAGGIFFAFFLVCGGLSLYILAVVGGLAGLCWLNYWLWGRSLSAQVAGEREEEVLRSALDDEAAPWDEPDPDGEPF